MGVITLLLYAERVKNGTPNHEFIPNLCHSNHTFIIKFVVMRNLIRLLKLTGEQKISHQLVGDFLYLLRVSVDSASVQPGLKDRNILDAAGLCLEGIFFKHGKIGCHARCYTPLESLLEGCVGPGFGKAV